MNKNSTQARCQRYVSLFMVKQIKKMNATPKATIETPDVKSTKENLQATISGETYEKDTMYPAFIKQTKLDKNTKAAFLFKHAMAVEVGHAELYSQALSQLDSWKDSGKVFLVCQVCGYTTMDKNIKKCPICDSPRKKFETIQ